MKYLFLVLTLTISSVASAQTAPPGGVSITQAGPKSPDSNGKTVYSFVEEMPGPSVDILEFLAKNIVYPDSARRRNIQGRVAIQFVVSEDGSLSDFKVVRGLGYGCDQEAIRVLKSMPLWKQAKQNGKAVKVLYTQPISFKLQ